jgi:hypothetical protein
VIKLFPATAFGDRAPLRPEPEAGHHKYFRSGVKGALPAYPATDQKTRRFAEKPLIEWSGGERPQFPSAGNRRGRSPESLVYSANVFVDDCGTGCYCVHESIGHEPFPSQVAPVVVYNAGGARAAAR